MTSDLHGVVEHLEKIRKTDYLYRLSIKGIIFNDAGEILFVKESGRDWWDLPGGGMDHGEDIETAIAHASVCRGCNAMRIGFRLSPGRKRFIKCFIWSNSRYSGRISLFRVRSAHSLSNRQTHTMLQ